MKPITLAKRFVGAALAFAVATTALFTVSFTASASAGEGASFDDLSQTQIVDAMGAGWNLGNQLESAVNGTPSETGWGNPTITSTIFKAVKNAGFKSVRIPVSYLSKIGSGPNYTIDSAWLNRVKEVVDMAMAQDLYVIINMHGDGYNSISGGWLLCNGSDQTTIKAKYKACWQQIAKKFANYDEHLIFESMNEEFDGTYGSPNSTYYSNINAYNQIFVDTVRQTGGNNAKRWLLIPGWNTDINYTAGSYGFSIPSDNYCTASGKRLMISVHYYTPWDFCGEESFSITQWGSISTNSSSKSSWGQEDYLDSQFATCYNAFVSKGYPVVVGEYGSIDKSNSTYREYFAKKVCEKSRQYGMIPVYWDNGHNGTYGFGLFDRSSGSVTQQGIINAIMSIYNSSYTPDPTPSTGVYVGLNCEWTERASVKVTGDGTYTVSASNLSSSLSDNVIYLYASSANASLFSSDTKIVINKILINGTSYSNPSAWKSAASPINDSGEFDVAIWNAWNSERSVNINSGTTVNSVSITFTLSNTGLGDSTTTTNPTTTTTTKKTTTTTTTTTKATTTTTTTTTTTAKAKDSVTIGLKSDWWERATVNVTGDGTYTISASGLSSSLYNNAIYLYASSSSASKLSSSTRIVINKILINGTSYSNPSDWKNAASPLNSGGEFDVAIWNAWNSARSISINNSTTVNSVSITFTLSNTGLNGSAITTEKTTTTTKPTTTTTTTKKTTTTTKPTTTTTTTKKTTTTTKPTTTTTTTKKTTTTTKPTTTTTTTKKTTTTTKATTSQNTSPNEIEWTGNWTKAQGLTNYGTCTGMWYVESIGWGWQMHIVGLDLSDMSVPVMAVTTDDKVQAWSGYGVDWSKTIANGTDSDQIIYLTDNTITDLTLSVYNWGSITNIRIFDLAKVKATVQLTAQDSNWATRSDILNIYKTGSASITLDGMSCDGMMNLGYFTYSPANNYSGNKVKITVESIEVTAEDGTVYTLTLKSNYKNRDPGSLSSNCLANNWNSAGKKSGLAISSDKKARFDGNGSKMTFKVNGTATKFTKIKYNLKISGSF